MPESVPAGIVVVPVLSAREREPDPGLRVTPEVSLMVIESLPVVLIVIGVAALTLIESFPPPSLYTTREIRESLYLCAETPKVTLNTPEASENPAASAAALPTTLRVPSGSRTGAACTVTGRGAPA